MYAEVNGTKLYYHTAGAGQPLMLMHGGLGLDHTGFLDSFGRLVAHAEVIYYDHRGNGRSQRYESLGGVTHETWVADADALRAHLGHEKIILFGHSYGGFLAQEYAVRHQDQLAGLILCSTAPVVDYMDVIQANAGARGTAEQLGALGQAFSRPMADDADFQTIWKAITPLYFHNYNPAVGEAMDARTSYSAAAWNQVNANCLPVFNVLAQLGQVNVPTLIISGIDDWITPLKQGGERIHAALPNSELIVFDKSGHWPFIEEQEKFVRVVGDWLARLG